MAKGSGVGELLKPLVRFIGCNGKIDDVEVFIGKVKSLESERDVNIQAINAEFIFGKDHLTSAKDHAIRAFERDENICETLPMEILLYASGEVQIKRSLDKLGLKPESCSMVMIVEGEIDKREIVDTLDLRIDETVFEPDLSKLQEFGIEKKSNLNEEDAKNFVLEKVALVDLRK